MANISTNVKKINIFQQMRRGFYRNKARNKTLSIDTLSNLPDYIKSDSFIIHSMVYSEKFSDDELRRLNPRILCQVKHDYEFIQGYPIDVQFELFKDQIVSPYYFTEEQRTNLLLNLIHNGKPNALGDISWGFMPEVDENIKSILEENGETELSDSLLQYFDSGLLSHMTREDPSIIGKLNSTQQEEYSSSLKKYLSSKLTYALREYAESRMDCMQYLDQDVRIQLATYFIKSGQYDCLSYLPKDEAKLLLNQAYKSKDMHSVEMMVPYFSGAELAAFINNNRLVNSQADIVINGITSEEELANFFDSDRNWVYKNGYEQSKNLGTLLTKYKKFACMFHLSEENRAEMEAEFVKLPLEEKKYYVRYQERLLKYLPPDEQSKYVEGNLAFLNYCSLDGKQQFIRNNPAQFVNIDKDIMLELVATDIRLYNYLPPSVQRYMLHNLDNKYANGAMAALIRSDIKNSKLVELEGNSKTAVPGLMSAFLGIENESDDKIKDYFLHSKFTSALGKLSLARDILHGPNAGEEILGIDSYTLKQIETIQRLSPNQVKQLVNIDVNYVLPYLTGIEINRLNDNEVEPSRTRAKDLFISMYGSEMYEQYEDCFDIVYKLQQSRNEDLRRSSYSGLDMVSDFDNFSKRTEIPLEEFKILFNSEILRKCDPSQIKQYFSNLREGKSVQQEFTDIIRTTYGDRASNILESRPQLNVHSINSLEVFDSQILDTYGDAFVHDCISYNLRDFSEFLEAQKDPQTREVFKNYYDILTEINGENVETMQKAISEFSYYKDLLLNIKDQELSDDQVLKLLNVLSSEKNRFDITSLEQLDHYYDFANQELQDIISNSDSLEIGSIKELLCQNLLGIHYSNSFERSYGDSVVTLNTLYDFSSDESSRDEYDETEKSFMNIINYIYSEKNKDKLIEFIGNIRENTHIRNIPAFRRVIDKVQERELSELNSHITTIDTLDRVCEEEKDKESPSVYKEEIDGVPIYHLNGYEYCMFSHNPGKISDQDFFSYEGQGGNSAICSRVVTPDMGIIFDHFLYGALPTESLITMHNADASTQHMAKRTRMAAHLSSNVKQLERLNSSGNEVAMYRRTREHSDITNENGGGRIVPMAYGASEISDISSLVKRFKGTGVAIFIRHGEKYKEKTQASQNIEHTESNER